MEPILYSIQDGIATITINRADSYNSFNKQTAMMLIDLLKEYEKEPRVRCIIITGSGKAFCAGQDIKELTDPESNIDIASIVAEHYNPIIELIRKIEKPIVAAVNGVAAGAGANIALTCDIVIAHESASFIQSFSKIGLIPDSGGTYFLPRLIGLQRATALMMLGDKVMAKEAQEMGMIYKAVPAEEYQDEVKKVAAKLAALPTKALGYTKCALNKSLFNELSKQLAIEEQLQTRASMTTDYAEGINAFLEKRKPEFTGE